MNVYPDLLNLDLPIDAKDVLAEYRKFRNFSVQQYLDLKAKVINQYFHRANLKAAVVGVSGGVDSAVVLGLMQYAMHQKESPIKAILPVFLPVYNKSASNQESARAKAKELCTSLGLSLTEIDLSGVHSGLSNLVQAQAGLTANEWANGQFVAHCRTPVLYYCATLLSANGLNALIAGTTNKDEGFYLGYVGKASDGLVDLQVISDLHKSEVFLCAKYLKVPNSILEATPTGDMFDSRPDEALFGASYDFVELFHFMKQVGGLYPHLFKNDIFLKMWNNLESLHKYNRHKYLACSPAVHIDIISDICEYASKESIRTNLAFAKDQYFKKSLSLTQLRNGIDYWKSKNKPFLAVEFPTEVQGKILESPMLLDFGLYG